MRVFFIKRIAPCFSVWLFLRLLTSLNAAFFSTIRPITLLEKEAALWPPSADAGIWLSRVFLAPWLHGPHKDPYVVLEFGEKLGLGSRDYELVDVLPVEKVERAAMPYIAAH